MKHHITDRRISDLPRIRRVRPCALLPLGGYACSSPGLFAYGHATTPAQAYANWFDDLPVWVHGKLTELGRAPR